MLDIAGLLNLVISFLSLAIIASVAISWLPLFGMRLSYSHPVVRIIEETADLILKPIRRALPAAGGGLDFSPVIAIILLQIARTLISRLFYGR